jgi:predicted Co/Zn/Cd cation transporter (cation efflux family)
MSTNTFKVIAVLMAISGITWGFLGHIFEGVMCWTGAVFTLIGLKKHISSQSSTKPNSSQFKQEETE